MYFDKLLKLGRRKTGNEVGMVRGENHGGTLEVNVMKTASLKESQQDAAHAAGQQGLTTKILAVQDGDHSSALVDYAVKMAQKLDCEIIALDASQEPMAYSGERREREIDRFQQRARKNAETLQLKAEAMGVTCTHLVRVGNQEEIIKALSQEDAGIRYVLLKPEQSHVTADLRRPRIPVVDLNCSSL